MNNLYNNLRNLLHNMKNDRKVLLGNIIVLPFIFLISNYVFSCNLDQWTNSFLTLILISVFIQFTSLNLISFKKSILSQIMLCCAYLFHLSYILLISLDYNFGRTAANLPFIRYDVESARIAFQLSWLFIYAFYGGILISLLFNNNVYRKALRISKLDFIDKINLKNLGISLVIVATPFFLHRTLTFLFNTLRYGYGFAANLEYNSYFQIIMKLMLPGLILWMISYKDSKKKSFLILILGLFLYSLAMLTGQRSFNFMYILILLSFYLGYIIKLKLNFKHVLLLIPLLLLASFILSFIREARISGLNFNIGEILNNTNNPILSMLNEFGITSNIVTYTYIESKTPLYGLQILASILIIIPGVSHIFPFIDFSKLNVTDALNAWNLGGSFIADFYFDFHYAGIIACLIFGFLIQRIFSYFINVLTDKTIWKAAFLCPILCDIIFCVRSTTYKIPRLTVYYSLFFLLICCISYYIEKKRKDEIFMNKIKNNYILYKLYMSF